MNIAENMAALVGNTPLVRLNRLARGCHAEVVAKLEFYNPCASVKDRIARSMIESALESGEINADSLLVEPTSGNTGVGLAFICAVHGLRLTLTMPESMSDERKKLLRSFGTTLVLTPAAQGMRGAIAEAERIVRETPGAVMLQQFANPANPAAHYATTAEEIWRDTDGRVDAFVAGVGTGGTITGTGRRLRELNAGVRIIAVEPEASPVLSGGAPAPHPIQGIGAGFVPEVLDTGIYDEVFKVSGDDAMNTARDLLRQEGILCGISSGANAFAALEAARRPEMKGKRIVFIVCDTGERYLSTPLFSGQS
ncbi:cysteine synthase A [Oleidesulfovibrio alaskensis G20]|uniref:Cysteine synthase n=1 Tax=Oleidesulfovibrio alaskensis (strain ATCC BAA-1058 / DSM 17464 / G20) TaxID=207559 RepID=Q30WS2_OLEA2|nr:cysteine synthase A [Oleidesulfovibrio alaskensis]ABB39874.1 cysteine synthase A [Oleidesulfovibrio alaskensis G20]MBG0773592.1 cysteine synthase A [Oleidesulfovibrio alaskensis]MBL3582083.1 cysteine synthase A [Oleidesulfovibrio alaskensis]